ncbi:MAG TPA: hypothetical protein DDZ80_06360 [Cyanobacteria bacterium UBA8803]|nr:hypothetical protein [Cyanobacteria bacterium UBA9273]HBL58155.1 hypothetical protein [Cyanobacteria bacterium UBA8803]
MGKSIVLSFWLSISLIAAKPALGLPPPEDVPEELLRTEIITEARSPIDGKPLTAAEYAELEAKIAERSTPPALDPEIQHTIFLLRLLDLLRTVTPL